MKSRDFASRISELAEKVLPHITNKEIQVAELTGEKVSTVRNWIFNSKKPTSSKRLIIADKVGVSEQFLFDEGDFSFPLAKYNEATGSFSIPVINERELGKLINPTNIISIEKRIETTIERDILSSLDKVENTFFFSVDEMTFSPFIIKGDLVLINKTALLKDGIFSIIIRNEKASIGALSIQNGQVSYSNENGNITKPQDNDIIIPIIMSVSKRY